MPEHTSHPDASPGPDRGHPGPIVSLAEVRAALAGVRGHAESDTVVPLLRRTLPGFWATIAAEYRVRNRVVDKALGAGIRRFVVFSPDLAPLRLAHELLPAGAGWRVLYLLDDAETAVRTRIVTTCSLDPDVAWLSATPGIEQCLRSAQGIGALALDEPVCVLASTALQHTRDPHALLAGLWNVLPPGSWVMASQVPPTPDTPAGTGLPAACAVFEHHTRTPLILRTAPEFDALFHHPHTWDTTIFGRAETARAPRHGPPLSTTDSSLALITRVAVRPVRTPSHGLVPAYRSTRTS
ncbi:hypothetical protein [Amycolatopsis sp. lyj-108]|uniref:hypothetical protein n=1 Tax=Amycolatopsis sp. lyj-108 TaxID=2789286 RepID=UPI003977EC7B